MEEEKKPLIWQRKEFRDAKKKWIEEGKMRGCCEKCGSKEFLTPDHTWTYKSMFAHYYRKTAIEIMAKEKGFTFTDSAISKGSGGFGINKNKGYVKIQEYGDFVRGRKDITKEATKKAEERYFSFKDVRTLCKNCNFARQKGLEPCPYCKKNYYWPSMYKDYSCCKDCVEVAEEEERQLNDWYEKGIESEYHSKFSTSKIKDLKDEELPDEIWDYPSDETIDEYYERGYEEVLDKKGYPVENEDDMYLFRKEDKKETP